MHLAMAAIGTLQTIQSIVRLAREDSKLLAHFEGLLMPMMTHVLQVSLGLSMSRARDYEAV